MVQDLPFLGHVALIAPAQRTNRSRVASYSQVLLLPHSSTSILFAMSKGRTILLAKPKLDLDFGMLVAVERFTTGANAHNLRGLANAYVLVCEIDQLGRAEEYRTRLLRELAGLRGRATALELASCNVA